MALITNPHSYKPFNEVLIQSDTEVDDVISTGKVTLFKDTTYDHHRSKRIYGTVAALPYRLSTERIHQEDNFYPVARQYFPGEAISRQAVAQSRQFRRLLNTAEERKLRSRYSCGIYEPEYTRLDHQPIEGQIGDKAYFHYLALSNDTYIGQDEDHKRYYRVPYQNIFCFVRDGRTTMVNGYVQVEPYWNEDYQEIEVDGKLIRGKLKGDLVVGLAEAPEYRTGVVRRKGKDYGKDTRSTVREGDIVLYDKGSEFKNTIEGKEVYLMQQWQIIAKKESFIMEGKEHQTFLPVGNYVHLRVNKKKGIILTVKELLEDKATVLAKGENCDYVSVGDEVIFNTGAEFFNVNDTIFIKEGQILARYEN